MKKETSIRFSVDKENKKIRVKREFAAPVSEVWTAWTDSRWLDRWWAPKPWTAKTKSMEFKEGGHWLYAMIGPDGSTHWSRADFSTIEPLRKFSALDAFSDENGKIDKSFPTSIWINEFSGEADITSVAVEISYEKLEDLEKMLEMGIREGFTSGLDNLEELLSKKQWKLKAK
ncbi:MAG: SRPBCC domain-containing protein [Salegentibacter sp.]